MVFLLRRSHSPCHPVVEEGRILLGNRSFIKPQYGVDEEWDIVLCFADGLCKL